jgi:crotonobetainyl-CoA:carnitine CoA-transferase CaiB-like acyl-CoA transferase
VKASPARRQYRCADGAIVAIACESEAHWTALAKCVGRPELAYGGDWEAARAAPYNGRLGRVLEALFREDAAEVWLRRLEAHGVPARIASRGQLPGDAEGRG